MSKVSVITQKDVARKAGVSLACVSYAMNGAPNVGEKTRQRIMDAARELGYAPSAAAKLLKTKNISGIGIVVPGFLPHGPHSLFASFAPLLAAEFATCCCASGIDYQVEYFRPVPEGTLPSLFTNRLTGGVVYYGTPPPYLRDYVEHKLNLPLVYFLENGPYSVSVDVENGMADLVGKLVAAGHRRIAFINGNSASSLLNEARTGYLRGLTENAIVHEPELELELIIGQPYDESVSRTLRMLYLERSPGKRPTVLLSPGDNFTRCLIAVCYRNGIRVPEQLGIVQYLEAWDSGEVYTPQISSLKYDLSDAMHSAVELLRGRMTGTKSSPERIVMPMKYCPRESLLELDKMNLQETIKKQGKTHEGSVL